MSSESLHLENRTPSSAPFSNNSPKLDRLIDGVRSLGQWYATDFERRLTSLSELLKTEIRAELKAQYTGELDAHVQKLRSQYEENIYAQASRWDSQRLAMEKEIEELKKKLPGEALFEEIAATENVLKSSEDRVSREPEKLIPDAASLSRMLASRVEEMSVKAYLRGLKFQIDGK